MAFADLLYGLKRALWGLPYWVWLLCMHVHPEHSEGLGYCLLVEPVSQERVSNRPHLLGRAPELLGHLLPLLQIFAQKSPLRFKVNAVGPRLGALQAQMPPAPGAPSPSCCECWLLRLIVTFSLENCSWPMGAVLTGR